MSGSIDYTTIMSLGFFAVFFLLSFLKIFRLVRALIRVKYSIVKVWGRCVEIQQINEGSETLYRPIYEFDYNGQQFRASKLDYEYEKNVNIGNVNLICVERAHPEVVVESPEEDAGLLGELVKAIIIAAVTLVFAVWMIRSVLGI